MPEWLSHFSSSLADQAGTWFVGLILAVLGVFSGRLVETIKFALNRADLRAKYYEEMATDISHFVFIVDRLAKVYYGSNWASDDDRSAIANEYNEVMNAICRKEYVYLSWLHRYWGQNMANAFAVVMDKIRAVDVELIRLNAISDKKKELGQLETVFHNLQKAAHALLMKSI
jgi:hypothetical protein